MVVRFLMLLGIAVGSLIITTACDHGRIDGPPVGPSHIDSAVGSAEAGGEGSAKVQSVVEASSSGKRISGTISIDSAQEGATSANGVLFIVARSVGAGAGGPPLAVLRMKATRFPVEFSLGEENLMIQGNSFSGQVVLTARLDSDGNVGTRGANDLAGEASGPVEVGTSNVSIRLTRPM